MMTLITKVIKDSDDQYIVAWSKGLKAKGFIRVEKSSLPDPDIIAEITAIQHLLFKQNIFNREIINGNGFKIVCHKLIKSVIEKKTSRKHLYPLLSFVRSNLNGCVLKSFAEIDNKLLAPLGSPEFEITDADPSVLNQDYDVFETPAMGRLKLTAHAIEQYKIRLHSGETLNPQVSLIKRLRNPNIAQHELPEKIKNQKIKKYGSVENTEIWGHDSSQMHFVVIRDSNNRGTVVTVYKRHQDFQ